MSSKIELTNDIAKNIKLLRTWEGQTQKQLGDSVGVSEQTIEKWENGRNNIKADMVIAIAKHFNISCDNLLFGGDTDNLMFIDRTGLSNETVNVLKTANDPRIQKAIDIMVKNRDILPFLFHFFTDADTVFESSGVYIKTESGERIPNPTYTQSDMERLCRLKLLDDLQAIREEYKGGKAK